MKSNLNCVLIIDDDQLTGLFHKLLLEEADCSEFIIIKHSAEEGLSYLIESSFSRGLLPFPNLIFLDREMPNMDGWRFLSRFKLIKKRLVSIPDIVMVTSIVDADTILNASKFLELSALYNKPMTLEMAQCLVA